MEAEAELEDPAILIRVGSRNSAVFVISCNFCVIWCNIFMGKV